ncbi:MAG: isoleucine--tRNA ligase [Candidatus Magasanikbacteria bacterium]
MSYNPEESEQEVLKFWEENNCFEKSIKQRSEDKPYVFYDGPPFATGLPHYGHILASTLKDAVPRYWTMKGYRVERRWGWDCHGLPIENMIEEELDLNSKKEIEEYGVDKFNQKAKESVMEYADEWETIIPRIGRWVDMENDYKTMDKDYMESVWWVFKQLFDRGYVYEGRKPMHVCPRCETPLAQGEVAGSYKEVKDLSVIAKFTVTEEAKQDNKELADIDETVHLLAWTTTPWTLPGNILMAVNEDFEYSLVKHEGDYYLTEKSRAMEVFSDKEFNLKKQIPGDKLVGLNYEPPFPYFENLKDEYDKAFEVVSSDFVDTEEGTGIVHIAPAFGEEDYQLYQDLEDVPFVQHVNMDGRFTNEVEDFSGQSVKTAQGHPEDHPGEPHQKADIQMIKYLYHNGDKLFDKEKVRHRYPHCWRCDTPLLNYATRSWFIEVTRVKDELLENNQKINWTPDHLKDGRFGNWLEGARDWAVSRNRYWGLPIPIWESEDGDRICIGSTEELEQLSGEENIEDLHKHVVDEIEFEKDGKTYKRTSEVFDCWFESGSMPYAHNHYPFENKDKFEQGFPAKFIAEGLDQTRGWFYNLHVLATILTLGEDSPLPAEEIQPAFKNVIVHGLLLGEDGEKMSKSKGNFPDPMDVVEKYGADALRYFLLTSPVVREEDTEFHEKEVQEVYNKLLNMVHNIHNFYSMFEDEVETEDLISFEPEEVIDSSSKQLHELDKWVISKLHRLIKEVTTHMDEYKLDKATRPIQDFVLDLSQWYIRRSRERFKSEDKNETQRAMSVLHYVFDRLARVMAPFTPFVAEKLYQQIKPNEESVHLQDWPEYKDELIDEKTIKETKKVRELAETGQALRQSEHMKLRQPLSEFAIGGIELSQQSKEILKDEMNVKEIINEPNEEGDWKFKESEKFEVALNVEITEKLKKEGVFRDIVRNLNNLRKKEGLTRDDKVKLTYETDSETIEEVLNEYSDDLQNKVQAEQITSGEGEHELDIRDDSFKVKLEVLS